MGTVCSYPGKKRPGREADHLSPSSAGMSSWRGDYLNSETSLHVTFYKIISWVSADDGDSYIETDSSAV